MTERGAGYFGEFGGRYVAEVLRGALDDLEEAFRAAMADPAFAEERDRLSRNFVGRPTPLLPAENATRALGGAAIWVKLEGLANTGAHKINNALGQGLLARRMGKRRIIAETGAGQHGVATAAVCAKLGLSCRIYMGETDIRRQRPNVFWMERFGAEVVPVRGGAGTLKDAVNEALRDWAGSYRDTHYLLGSALGPSPFPDMVREFQSVIGRETQAQLAEAGVRPAALVACVGGGSNAIGFFSPFLERGWAAPDRGGGGRARRAAGGARRAHGRGGAHRHRAGLQVAVPAGRGRAGPADPLPVRRAGLSGHRPAAGPPGTHGPHRVRAGGGPGGGGRAGLLRPAGGPDLRPGVGARRRGGHAPGAEPARRTRPWWSTCPDGGTRTCSSWPRCWTARPGASSCGGRRTMAEARQHASWPTWWPATRTRPERWPRRWGWPRAGLRSWKCSSPSATRPPTGR